MNGALLSQHGKVKCQAYLVKRSGKNKLPPYFINKQMKKESHSKPGNEVEKFKMKDLKVSAYKIPTDIPESDGTIEWDSTTLVLVEVNAGGKSNYENDE